ncbi:MAG: hypothetical protein ACR2MG_14650 [Pyrinomonadaceae bacterium]
MLPHYSSFTFEISTFPISGEAHNVRIDAGETEYGQRGINHTSL